MISKSEENPADPASRNEEYDMQREVAFMWAVWTQSHGFGKTEVAAEEPKHQKAPPFNGDLRHGEPSEDMEDVEWVAALEAAEKTEEGVDDEIVLPLYPDQGARH